MRRLESGDAEDISIPNFNVRKFRMRFRNIIKLLQSDFRGLNIILKNGSVYVVKRYCH